MSAPRGKLVAAACFYAALLVGGSYFGKALFAEFDIAIWPHTESMVSAMMISGIVLYVILTAIPFVPGVEVGLALILTFGVRIAPVVYAATVAALVLSFLAGRLVPAGGLAAAFHWLGLAKAARLIAETAPLDNAGRISHLVAHAPNRLAPWLLRHRYIALAALINLPGSALLGGGGGIAMAAGMSGLMRFPAFLATVMIAVAPVPLFLIVTAALGAAGW